MKVFLDTHAAVFLWEGKIELFGKGAISALESGQLYMSPMVRLELEYLYEIKRIHVAPDEIIGGLKADLGVMMSDDHIAAVVSHAMELTWTRDPFDRLIVATANLHNASLITRDRLITKHVSKAIWH